MYRRYVKGQSLLSLMLSISLSSFLLIIIFSFYTYSQKQNQEMRMQLYLQNEIERVLQLMAKDLRRSGFLAVTEKLQVSNFPFFELDDKGTSVLISQASGEAMGSCVLFFYDLDSSGCIGSTYTKGLCIQDGKNQVREIERELFGYRLNKKMLETRLTYKNTVNQECSQEQCRTYTQQPACEKGGWVDLFDNKEIAISQFFLQWLKEGELIEAHLMGYLVKQPHIQYKSHIVIPLLNQGR